ncbi:phage integrase central domain-containing protein [Bradyrhizobium sp. JYMT SZCCT0428]|uniref:tyrosine-type recombinase/integrase n=1 Tax=Bradyrhizobium sp. JYMT SZCCT0428 TaxID=2807673 RepID=UPI001BA7D17B|nr:integrase arm-type DNA-binding domain-containing protein [Bradyrhizobium sp. JYMT SZCCT0428]MBR1156808.1 tyrosine-type recombinase/integrase [Bradyrhizobium sp. JYMT SZCCT0428]
MPVRNDAAFRSAKPREKPFKLSDGGGLFLLIQPNGAKLWRLAYRFDGKQKLLALGQYPITPLTDARLKRDAAKRLLSEGADPSMQRKSERLTARTSRRNTFKTVAEDLMEKFKADGDAATTLKKKQWLLDFANAEFGNRPVAEIKAPEILEALRKIEKRGRHETATRVRSTVGAVFRYAIATARAERDPSVDLRGALITPTVTHRATIVEPNAVGALLRAIDGFEGQPTTRYALRLAPLVFVRPGELRKAEWAEFNINAAEWRIPGTKMKMRRPHRVPLADQALAILAELREITGGSKYLFPSVRSWYRPISENTLNAALRRLGYDKSELTVHGLRSTASSLLNESGKWHADAIERQLAHQEQNEIRSAYMHAAEFWQERVRMMRWWASHLDELRERGRVVTLRA